MRQSASLLHWIFFIDTQIPAICFCYGYQYHATQEMDRCSEPKMLFSIRKPWNFIISIIIIIAVELIRCRSYKVHHRAKKVIIMRDIFSQQPPWIFLCVLFCIVVLSQVYKSLGVCLFPRLCKPGNWQKVCQLLQKLLSVGNDTLR